MENSLKSGANKRRLGVLAIRTAEVRQLTNYCKWVGTYLCLLDRVVLRRVSV